MRVGGERMPPDAQRRFRGPRRLASLVVASDPGLSRLRMAASAATCVLVGLAAEFGLALLLGATGMSVVVFMLFGGLVGMIGSNAFAGHQVWENVRISAFFPVALALGLLVGIAVSWSTPLTLIVFVVVMFAAVYIRRFGTAFFFSGFLIWMGYFLAAFIHATIDQFWPMMLAIVVATAIVLLLCSTVFRPHPRRTLTRVFRSMDARSRSLLHACAVLLEAAPGSRDAAAAQRRIVRIRAQVRDATLMSDGWAAYEPALPAGWSAAALRRGLLDRQLSLDRIVAAARVLTSAPLRLRAEVASALDRYAASEQDAASTTCASLDPGVAGLDDAGRVALRYLQQSITDLAATQPEPEIAAPDGMEYQPATNLFFGQLPGSPSVATDVAARGTRWNPLARLRFTTRQAIQVAVAGALAIIAGSAISQQRYYWAVIATFVAFTGTGTRIDTAQKAINRVIGTLVGLLFGVLLATLTSGHVLWALVVVVVSIFCGFYLMRVSYAYLIFFITIMVSELYSILGEFSDELLLVRLEETALGAGIGIVVALLVTPLSTRDTVRHAEREVLRGIADLLEAAAERLEDSSRVPAERMDQLMLGVDNSLRRLDLVAGPLTRHYVWERRPRHVRRMLAVVTAAVATTRELATRSRNDPRDCTPAADVYRARAHAFRRRATPAAEADGERQDLPVPLDTTEVTVVGERVEIPGGQELQRLSELLMELTDI